VLIAAKLLHPLGKPAPNGQKYFALCELEACYANRKWLEAASEAINRHWQMKNGTCPTPIRSERREKRFLNRGSSARVDAAGAELMKAE
jgi:hypothetical protein